MTPLALPILTLKRDATIPPGSRWMFIERPERPQPKPPARPRKELPLVSLIQFAIGSRVAPRYRDAVRLTERFRSRVLGRFAELVMGHRLKNGWRDASDEVRAQAVLLSGKDADGKALAGHRHAFFFLHGEPAQPTRLCVWRAEPFTDTEQRAILSAAQTPLPLSFKGDPWTVTLVPLDSLVPAPAGFASQPSRTWQTLTLYVPPRHVFDRKGRVKESDDVGDQLRDELAARGLPPLARSPEATKKSWVKVHRPSRQRGEPTNDDKLGYEVTLEFSTPVAGPMLLGNSCHFGLGLFVPIAYE